MLKIAKAPKARTYYLPDMRTQHVTISIGMRSHNDLSMNPRHLAIRKHTKRCLAGHFALRSASSSTQNRPQIKYMHSTVFLTSKIIPFHCMRQFKLTATPLAQCLHIILKYRFEFVSVAKCHSFLQCSIRKLSIRVNFFPCIICIAPAVQLT